VSRTLHLLRPDHGEQPADGDTLGRLHDEAGRRVSAKKPRSASAIVDDAMGYMVVRSEGSLGAVGVVLSSTPPVSFEYDH
tara:strand:- start:312 stop:551 length:240 start_codon:yes stop_codon:yes gene_type:complete